MTLALLLKAAGLPAAMGRGQVHVSGLSLDSRRTLPGQLFCAIPSASVPAAPGEVLRHLRQALEQGAAAVLALPAVLKAARPFLGAVPAVPSGIL